MSLRRLSLFPLALLLAFANPVSADSDPGPRAVANVSPKDLDQIIYKGLVGNVLDGIPMDPSNRVNLQRTNAIISNTLSGRSPGALAGMANPVLLIGGLVWGIWAASNIKPEDEGVKTAFDAGRSGGEIPAQESLVALLDTAADRVPREIAAAKPVSAAEPPQVRPPVVKVWLPQRGSSMALAQ